MNYEQEVASRISVIGKRVDNNLMWTHMAALATNMFNSLKSTGVLRKVELRPNDMINGSIVFYIDTMPKDIIMKVWQNSDVFYIAFFLNNDEYFEHQIQRTFNENGTLPCDSLDDVEDRLLDFFASVMFNKKHNITLE